MKVVALISGGKDSCYNMMQCVQNGHEIVALANLRPPDKDEMDSYMYQTVGHQAIDMYAEAMGLPLFRRTIQGSSVEIGMNYVQNEQDEVEDLYELLLSIKSEVKFEAVSVGAILSDYQRVRVEHVCSRLGVSALAYLWRRDQRQLYEEMIANGLVAVIIKVAVMGLTPRKHLGLTMQELHPVLLDLNSKFGVNICGEGGEYETFTLDCPLFKKRISIDDSSVVIHSDDAFAQVGFLQLNSLHLEEKQENKQKSKYIPVVPYCGDPIENIPDSLTNSNFNGCTSNTANIRLPENCNNYSKESITYDSTDGYLWISGLKAHHQGDLTVQQVTKTVMEKLKDKIEQQSYHMEDVILMQLFVKQMNDFSQINSVYKSYFPVNPPSRTCVEADLEEGCVLTLDCLLYKCINSDNQTYNDDETGKQERPCYRKESMHVQSISHWASANIGPYSQVTKVGPTMFISGCIGLWPASMTMIQGGISVEAALALRHVDRIITAFSNSTQSLLNGFYGVCYVTCYQDIAIAEEAFKTALQSKICEDTNHKVDIECLVSYVVVPSLPKGASVEWQFISHQHLDQFRGLSSVQCENASLEFQGLFYQDEALTTCCAINCDIAANDLGDVYIHKKITSYVKELRTICSRHRIGFRNLLSFRIFYIKKTLKDNTESELYSSIRSSLEQLCEPMPAFTIIPVIGLKGRAVISIHCLFLTS